MNEWEQKKHALIFFYFYFFYFLSLFPFSGNEFVYVIAKIGAAAGVINIVMMSVVLYFQSKKMRHLLN